MSQIIFNDPKLYTQWHYLNNHTNPLKSIAVKALERTQRLKACNETRVQHSIVAKINNDSQIPENRQRAFATALVKRADTEFSP